MAEPGPSKGIDWMYQGPSALVDREDYLLGRAVDKSFKILEAQEKGEGNKFSYADEVQKDLTPASIFANRGNPNAAPIDIVRKIKEDPLYQIEKKEQETLKQLLQNPIKLKQLKQIAEQQKALSKSKKHKKKHKKRRSSSSSSSDSDSGKKLDKGAIDRLLATKLSALKKKSGKGSSSSSDDSDHDKKVSKSHRDRRDEHRTSAKPSEYKSQSLKQNDRDRKDNGRSDRDRGRRDRSRERQPDRLRRPSPHRGRDRRDDYRRRRSRSRSPRERSGTSKKEGASSSRDPPKQPPPPQRKPLSEEEMERRRKEMMENAKTRDEDRRSNVERWKEEQRKEDEELAKEHNVEFIRKHLLTAAETGSVEKRIKSNSYNIQKASSAMNQNFARR